MTQALTINKTFNLTMREVVLNLLCFCLLKEDVINLNVLDQVLNALVGVEYVTLTVIATIVETRQKTCVAVSQFNFEMKTIRERFTFNAFQKSNLFNLLYVL